MKVFNKGKLHIKVNGEIFSFFLEYRRFSIALERKGNA